MAGFQRFDSFFRTVNSWQSMLRIACAVALVSVAALAGTVTTADANPRYAAIVIDGHTGRTIFSRSADRPRYPASLTKVMTLYVLFEELEAGNLRMDTRMRVSRRASEQPPSKIGVTAGSTITVNQAIRALVTKSANDVAVVVAEHISGSESRFAQRMTRRARALGMTRTRFMNASGLPNSRQLTTARDMAKLAINIQEDFPQYYGFFSITEFRYNGRRYTNHNNLVGRYRGTTGLKTGYTRASGYNLTATVERGGKYLIGVVLGGRRAATRDRHMREILDRAWGTAVARNETGTSLANALPRPRPGGPASATLQLASTAPIPAQPPQGDRTPSTEEPLASATLRSTSYPTESAAFSADTWVIQIGAYADPALAVERIRDAVDAAPLQLANAVPITMPFPNAGSTLYRSRFGGMTRTSARAACQELNRQNISCIAIPPSGWGREMAEVTTPRPTVID